MGEQLIVILTTTLSLLTAWSWDAALQKYVGQYYGDSLTTKIITAIVITAVTFIVIGWLLHYLKIKRENIEHTKRAHLTHYIKDKGLGIL